MRAPPTFDEGRWCGTHIMRAPLTVVKVANYEKAIAAFCSAEHTATLDKLKARLESFIPDDVPKSSGAKRVPKSEPTTKKITKETLAQLATPEEVSQLLAMYDQFFGPEADSGEDLDVDDSQCVTFGEPVEGASPGVEVEAKMTSSQLADNLGFSNNMPLMFNTKRHSGGHSGWSKEYEDALKVNSNALELFALQWHQLAGVHAALRKVLSPTPDSSHCTGILFADDVGLGKTIQASSIMASLSLLSVLQARGRALPPIARDLPYLKDSSSIPDHPHLVLMPGTLLRQWEHELQCFFKNKSVDILIYGTTPEEHVDFWKPDGIYHSSNHPPSHRIILATHSALQRDFTGLYTSHRGSRDLPWEHPERAFGYEKLLPNTLFGHDFLTVTLDEAQGMRNDGQRHSAALRVLEQAAVRIILTATPLQTSTKDISAMARLTGIPFFFTYQAYCEQVRDNAALRRGKKERNSDDGTLAPDEDPVKTIQVEISKRLQSRFQGRVIRREADSVDNEGNKLISLPPLHVSHCILHLTEREKEILENITLENLSDASSANGRNITSTNFYIEHRMGVTFARADPSEPIPVFKSLPQWEEQMSTKIHNLVCISIHFLTRDDMGMVTSMKGALVYPPRPTTPHFTQDVKILIYQEFPSNTNLVRNVFSLHGVKTLAISGRDSFDKRAKTVSVFNEDPTHRVLIFSKVGSTGLNLTRANIILFLDQPWSAQDEKQIIGRAWRQRQRRPVYAIHLLAADTADITLFSLAQGKKDMLDAFLTTDASQALMHVMTGDILLDEEEEEERPLLSRRSRKKAEGKKKKAEPDSKDEKTSNEVEGVKEKKKSKGKGKRKIKSAEIINEDGDDDAQDATVPTRDASSSKIGSGSPKFKVPPLPPASFENKASTKSDTKSDDDFISFSKDVSIHGIESERYETDFDSRPPSTHAGDSSISSFVEYESSDDEMDVEVPVEPTVRWRTDSQASLSSDVEMTLEDSYQEDFQADDASSEIDSSTLARKRSRALSPPPSVTPHLGIASNVSSVQSPKASVTKKARLDDPVDPPHMDPFESDNDGVEDAEDGSQSPLMKPLFPTLLSSLGVDDGSASSPAPHYAPPSSPTPHPNPSVSTTRKLNFMKAKPFEFKPVPTEDPFKKTTRFGGVGDSPSVYSPFLVPSYLRSHTETPSTRNNSFPLGQPHSADASAPDSHPKAGTFVGVDDSMIPSSSSFANPTSLQERSRSKLSTRKNPFARPKDPAATAPPPNPPSEVKSRGIPEAFRPRDKTKERVSEEGGNEKDSGSQKAINTSGVNRHATSFFSTPSSQASSSRLPPASSASRPNPNSQKPRKSGPRR